MAKQNANDQTTKDKIDTLHTVPRIVQADDPPPVVEDRHGFLPFQTNAFDRGFISVLLLIAIHLLWMRFLEASLPLEIATIISLALAVVIYRKG